MMLPRLRYRWTVPKRKQPSILKTKDATGAPLSRRKRWHSHGVERQAATGDALTNEVKASLHYAEDEALTDQWWQSDFEASSREYQYDNQRYDRYLDALASHLEATFARRSMLDVAPAELRALWRTPHSDSDLALARGGLEGRIVAPWQASAPLTDQIRGAIGSIANVSLIHQVCTAEDRSRCAASIVFYAPLWIREPRSFAGNGLHDLLEHLFVKYPVPDILYGAWPATDALRSYDDKWRQWFLCFAQGGSLYRLGQLSQGWEVSKRFAHQFPLTTETASIRRAAISTELSLLGISAPAAQLLLNCAPYQIDVTALWNEFDQRFLEHWRDTARWIEQHVNALDQGIVDYLLDWSSQQVRLDNHNFSWSGRTINASMRHADVYFQNDRQPSFRWNALDIDWQGTDGWAIQELTSSAELLREGKSLSHCVGGYGLQCKRGHCAIFSLRYHSKPVITIQLDPVRRTVMQALGHQNRPCTADEMALIRQWLAETA